jgi:hypothetical protein
VEEKPPKPNPRTLPISERGVFDDVRQLRLPFDDDKE